MTKLPSPTQQWYEDIVWGGDYEYPAFCSWPPVDEPLLQDPNKVLVCCTGSQYDIAIRLAKVIAEERGIHQPIFVYCKSIGTFWPHFFGSENFVEAEQERRIPSLIVATGDLRHHDPRNIGMTFSVGERLEEVAAKYNVPIRLVPQD